MIQKFSAWIKKSAKGPKEWLNECRSVVFSPWLIPTTVKTRFIGILVIFKMMLKYKEVVKKFFGDKHDRNLRKYPIKRYGIVHCVVQTLEQLVVSFLESQKKN